VQDQEDKAFEDEAVKEEELSRVQQEIERLSQEQEVITRSQAVIQCAEAKRQHINRESKTHRAPVHHRDLLPARAKGRSLHSSSCITKTTPTNHPHLCHIYRYHTPNTHHN
jgi:hypothetical protein